VEAAVSSQPGVRQRLDALRPEQRAALDRALARRVQKPAATAVPERRARRADSTMDFSLFFFSGNGATDDPGKYDLLLDCARYADAHGFSGIWLPERHFVEFGGLYPNPSVLAAAVAVVTSRIQLRAGSVVLPLHHPVRIAEEWAVVDNLSGGRVAISAASGWHPDDFVVAPAGPAGHATRREDMYTTLDVLRRLWSGEEVGLDRGDGTEQRVRTYPRPRQSTLPLWLSATGSTDTFLRAGALGANILTGAHAGQRLDEVGERIAAYRKARADNGHDPAAGVVTMMVHTYLGTDEDAVRAEVRGPLIGYLETFLRQQPGAGADAVRPADREALLGATFDRYYESLALLGTPEKAAAFIEDLVDIGVTEVACLVDFGVPAPRVLAALDHLTALRETYRPGRVDG
jgi:natural product biosynthesis luciferase-like monooxygenase protein